MYIKQTNNGENIYKKISENVQLSTFDYYYQRMKKEKMTLLRMYQNIGMDLSWLYDIIISLTKKKNKHKKIGLDKYAIEEI